MNTKIKMPSQLLIMFFLVFSLLSCSKKSTSTNPPSNSVDPIGVYSGVVYTDITKIPAQSGPNLQPIYEKKSYSLTVNITKDGEKYKLDNNIMIGGPRVFYYTGDGSFELDVELKTIKYTYFRSAKEFVKVGSSMFDYQVTENRNGVLKK